jgi:hypothetical protein
MMRTATRFSRRVTAAAFVILTGLFAAGMSLAEAQTNDPQAPAGYPVWSPEKPTVLESDGEVVLTLSMSRARAARVTYKTLDGNSYYAKNDAMAPGDYSAVSGEVVLNAGDTVKIKIPIVDDDSAEYDETFRVWAYEEPTQGALQRGDASIRIIDDDGAGDAVPPAGTGITTEDGPATAGSSTITPQGGQVSGSAIGAPEPTSGVAAARAAATTTSTTASAAQPGEVALASGELRPGPGFELTSEAVPKPAPQRPGPSGSASGLAIGSGFAAVGAGALAVVRRRRRWSPTQA